LALATSACAAAAVVLALAASACIAAALSLAFAASACAAASASGLAVFGAGSRGITITMTSSPSVLTS
jgi:hypothetical protein